MEMLKNGKSVDIPKYDFKSYKNTATQRVSSLNLLLYILQVAVVYLHQCIMRIYHIELPTIISISIFLSV